MSGKAWDSDSEYRLPEGYTPWGEFIEDDEDEDDLEPPELTPAEREASLRALFGYDTEMTLEEMEAEMADFWESFLQSGPGNTLETELAALDLQPKQEFMYLFDFGDEHRFKVRVHAISKQADPTGDYPRLVESVGDSPPQYYWEDEW
jgi:hypothetical protein